MAKRRAETLAKAKAKAEAEAEAKAAEQQANAAEAEAKKERLRKIDARRRKKARHCYWPHLLSQACSTRPYPHM